MDRQATLSHIRDNPDVPVLIIGAGVNGVGTFLDLALQGVDAYIVDKADFASGATAASSHMAHGGIRYLENGEFRLVKEAVGERNRMIKNAPHIVVPLPTAIPIFRMFSGIFNAPLKFVGLLDKPAERGLAVIKIGLMTYDAYTGGDNRQVPRHKVFHRRASLTMWPKLNPNVQYTARYYDGHITKPERYVMEMILDAEAANEGSVAANYVSAVGAEGDSVTLRDEQTGEEFSVKPQIVINAAGPWIDFANENMGLETRFIGGTKGSHLVLHHPELNKACNGHEMFFENDDGRIVLCFPFGPDRVLVGTTDIPVEDPDEAVCSDEEIEYIFGLLPKVFPDIEVKREDVVFTYCGVRPLQNQDANSAGQISRDHLIKTVEPAESGFGFPILNLIGGKWTSYRAFSEETADEIMHHLGAERKMTTKDYAIGGGKDYPEGEKGETVFVKYLASEHGISTDRARDLFDRYGTRADAVAGYIKAGEDTPLRNNPNYSEREIRFIIENERVVHLEDILLRRTMIPMWGTLNRALLDDLAAIAGDMLGWDEATQNNEVERTISVLSSKHRVNVTSADQEAVLV